MCARCSSRNKGGDVQHEQVKTYIFGQKSKFIFLGMHLDPDARVVHM